MRCNRGLFEKEDVKEKREADDRVRTKRKDKDKEDKDRIYFEKIF